VGSLLPGLWLWFKMVLRRVMGLSNQDELSYLGKEFACAGTSSLPCQETR
jgi:hypothetical protein